MKPIYLCLFVLLMINNTWSQQNSNEPLFIVEGDSIPKSKINLDEIILYRPLTFNSNKDSKAYYLLRYRILKVYPYAKLAAERLHKLNSRLDSIQSKRQKKKYAKRIEKYLEGEFAEELKKLTRKEGQLLVKLIHRETGFTPHYLVKKLRNGWRAFIYQTTARMFDINLKTIFDPQNNKEDRWINEIIERAKARGRLKKIS